MQLSFHGTLGRYWRIHCLGLLLSILTLGLYSPWAKMRRHRYLLGNTKLIGSSFEFDATPWSILVSRIIVVAVLLLAALANSYVQVPLDVHLNMGMGTLLVAILFPLAMARGRAFHARHTLWRGVRFKYAGGYLQLAANYGLSYVPLLIFGLFNLQLMRMGHGRDIGHMEAAHASAVNYVAALALYLAFAWPALVYWRHRILLGCLSFGALRLRYKANLAAYYAIYVSAVALLALLFMAAVRASVSDESLYWIVPSAAFALAAIYSIPITKLFWSSIEISDGSRIASRVTLHGLFEVYLTNALTIILSFGLLLPMAIARNWRYIAANVAIVPGSMLGSVLASQSEAASALGEEGIDMLDFELDAGVI